MAVDLSNVDIRGAYSKHLDLGRKQANTHGGEFWTCCPWCGTGDDRFHVWPYRVEAEDNPTTHWCRICGSNGDIVSFIEYVENRDFIDACGVLNIDLNGSPVSKPRVKYHPNDDEAPADKWRPIAIEFAKECKAVLWSEQGKNALSWLRARGLSDDTINRAGLGYNPATRWDEKEDWAVEYRKDIKKVWVPRGIVIPWVVERQLWKISIRRPDPELQRDIERGIEHPAKYVAIAGGSNGLYGVDTFNYERPTVVVEGEFDKLILSQVVGSNANVFATGSTAKGRGEKWALLIAQSPTVLIAYDADEGGKKAMKDYWLKYLPQSLPWQPWAKDINAMFLEGQDLKEWFQMGVELAQPSPIIESVPVEEPITELIDFSSEDDWLPITDEQVQNAGSFLRQMLEGTCPTDASLPDTGPLAYLMSLIFHDAYCEAGPSVILKAVRTLAIDAPILADILAEASVGEEETQAPSKDIVQWNAAVSSKKSSLPPWLIPGTYDWDRLVARVGIEEVNERRQAALTTQG